MPAAVSAAPSVVFCAASLSAHSSTVSRRSSKSWNSVHCRIGSSETLAVALAHCILIHCRIGSSENVGKLFLILDNLRVHHAKPVKAWLAEHADAIEIF